MDNKILMFLILGLLFIQVPGFAAPQWSINQSFTPSTYSPSTLSEFNVTWDNEIDTVLIEINYIGSFDNYIMTETYAGDVYNYSIILPAGTFQWRSYANNTTNSWDVTDTWTVTISKAPTETNLTLNGNEGNMSCEQYDNVTFVAQINVTGLDINLTSSYSGVEDANTTIINKTVNLTEIGGLYYVTALYSGNVNYLSSSTIYFFDTQGPQYSNINTSDTTYSFNKTYQFNITWIDATLDQVWFEFNYNNGTISNYTNQIQNSSGVFWIGLTNLSIGNYTYRWFASDTLGKENTTGNLTYNVTLGSVLHLAINGAENDVTVNYGDSVNITCWSTDSYVTNEKFDLLGHAIDNTITNYTIFSTTTNGTTMGMNGDYTYYCNIIDPNLVGNYNNATSCILTVNPQPTEEPPSPSPGGPTGGPPISGAILIQDLTSELTVNAGESKSTTFSLKNIYSISFTVNISISGVSSTWYRLDKTSVRIPGDSSETITLRFNIPKDATVKDYLIRVTVSGGTNPQDTFTLTVNPSVEEVTIEQTETIEETNVTANETAAAPTGLFPFNLIDPTYIVLIVGIAACVLILTFRFRGNITGFVSKGYKAKPIKEKRIEVKPKEKVIKKKPEKKRKKRFSFSGLKLRLTLVKEKKEKK